MGKEGKRERGKEGKRERGKRVSDTYYGVVIVNEKPQILPSLIVDSKPGCEQCISCLL